MVNVSPKQMSRMRKGHRVRVRPPQMEGEGVCLIVEPGNYSLLSKTFSRNKGAEISLSPEELVANKQIEGNGIFGKKFDRSVKKLIGKKATKEIYDIARSYLPMAQAGLTAGLTSGATALGVSQPQLVPFLPGAVAGLSALGSDYLANPSKYQSKKKASSLAQEYAKDMALQQLNQRLGTNMGNLSRASIEQAVMDKASAEMQKRALEQRERETGYDLDNDGIFGSGLYLSSGNGLYASRRNGGAVGINRLSKTTHPALQSQANSENFQLQYTLPPAYQKIIKRGSGLYM